MNDYSGYCDVCREVKETTSLEDSESISRWCRECKEMLTRADDDGMACMEQS